MAAREEDDDPAVYGSGTRQKNKDEAQMKSSNGHTNGLEPDEDEDEEDDDGSALLTVQPGFNRLLLVLRDPGVLRFVKYVSAMAPGSRWDISGEWEVGQVELDSDDDQVVEQGDSEQGYEEDVNSEEDGEGEEEEL